MMTSSRNPRRKEKPWASGRGSEVISTQPCMSLALNPGTGVKWMCQPYCRGRTSQLLA